MLPYSRARVASKKKYGIINILIQKSKKLNKTVVNPITYDVYKKFT